MYKIQFPVSSSIKKKYSYKTFVVTGEKSRWFLGGIIYVPPVISLTPNFLFLPFQALGSAILLTRVPSCHSVIVRLVYDLVRNNLIGRPEFYKDQKWPLDPEAGARRQPDFVKVHGYHSANTIEKLGLGTDGYQEIRREQQRLRDLGVPTQLPHTVPGGIPAHLAGVAGPYPLLERRPSPLHQSGSTVGDSLSGYYKRRWCGGYVQFFLI